MKKIIPLLLFLLVTSCKSYKNERPPQIVHDTVFVETVRIDTVKIIDYNAVDSLAKKIIESDSIITYRDFENARRIEKIKYYVNICENNSANKKFFYGWIKRTLSE